MINMDSIKTAVALALQKKKIREVMNRAPNCIHEDDYKELNCVLCNKVMKTIHDTHNAFPLAKLQSAKEAFDNPEKHSRCCSECDQNVLVERFKLTVSLRNNKSKSNHSIDTRLLKYKKVGELKISEPVEIPISKISDFCIFETPESQKRFKELGQNFYETDLGKCVLKRKNDKSSSDVTTRK